MSVVRSKLTQSKYLETNVSETHVRAHSQSTRAKNDEFQTSPPPAHVKM